MSTFLITCGVIGVIAALLTVYFYRLSKKNKD